MSDKKKLRVLYVCDDDAVRFKHELMLEEAGYEVAWLPSNGSFRTANIRSFQAAILCQSLDWKRAALLSTQLRRFHPSIDILRVNTLRSEMENGFDVDCEIVAGPEFLIDILDSLNRKQSDKAALLA